MDDVAAGQIRVEIDKAIESGADLDMDALNKKLGSAVLSELEREEQEIARENAVRQTAPGIVDIIWDRIDSIRHVLMAILIAYFLGRFGWHMFWVLFLFYFAYAADAKYKLRGFRHFYKLKKLKSREKQAQREAVEESALWFNHLMAALWPNISNFAAVETKRFMGDFIQQALSESPPPGVQSVYVRQITLGLVPPEIKLLKPYRFEDRPSVYQLDITLRYAGELQVTIVAQIGSGLVKTKLPVQVLEVKMTAQMRFVIEFFPESPFIKTLDVAFRSVPNDWLDFNIKVMGALNVLSLPGIKSWVLDSITSAVRGTMELPKTIHVRMGGEDEDVAASSGADSEKPKERITVPLKMGEKNPFSQYKGHIKVVLVEAKNLIQTDVFGTTDAYAKLQLNDVWYRSPTITNTLDPVWNASYEIPLEATEEEQVLQIRVKDWDPAGRNDLQGTADIFVSRMEPDKPIDVTAYLQNPDKEQKGTVHLIVTYSPDRNLGE